MAIDVSIVLDAVASQAVPIALVGGACLAVAAFLSAFRWLRAAVFGSSSAAGPVPLLPDSPQSSSPHQSDWSSYSREDVDQFIAWDLETLREEARQRAIDELEQRNG